MSISEFKASMAGVAKQASALDQEDAVQRRAFVKVMEAAAAVAKVKLVPALQQPLPLDVEKSKGKGA